MQHHLAGATIHVANVGTWVYSNFVYLVAKTTLLTDLI